MVLVLKTAHKNEVFLTVSEKNVRVTENAIQNLCMSNEIF